MNDQIRKLLLWSPRALGVAVACFLALFALDVFAEGRGRLATAGAFVLHLAPTFLLLLTVALAWRRPWVGAVVFLVLAMAYAIVASRHPSWVLVISGPLALVGLLYVLGARLRTA
jgi:hypothetical protein